MPSSATRRTRPAGRSATANPGDMAEFLAESIRKSSRLETNSLRIGTGNLIGVSGNFRGGTGNSDPDQGSSKRGPARPQLQIGGPQPPIPNSRHLAWNSRVGSTPGRATQRNLLLAAPRKASSRARGVCRRHRRPRAAGARRPSDPAPTAYIRTITGRSRRASRMLRPYPDSANRENFCGGWDFQKGQGASFRPVENDRPLDQCHVTR